MTREVIIRELSKLSNTQLVRLLAMDGLSEILLAEASLRLGVEGASEMNSEAITRSESARLLRYTELWNGQPESDYDAEVRLSGQL